MITVTEAQSIINNSIVDFGTERIALMHSIGKVLRENIYADRDFPPYNRVTMDGIAIQYDEFANGRCNFNIEGIAPAGAEQKTLSLGENCLEVMTGSIMPLNADTVIPYEQVIIENGMATIDLEQINQGKNIHLKGFDKKIGELLIREGKKIAAPEIGVCATVGKAEVLVSKMPNAIIISTGDELVDINETPLPHQIRRSNIYRLQTVLQSQGIAADNLHLDDKYDEIIDQLKSVLENYELVILSGGVSKGKFDFLPKALEELDVEKRFHRIAQRPGKPFWFGTYQDKTTVFAFPGNPVSSFMCAQVYFVPWLNKCLKTEERPTPKAVLTEDFEFNPNLSFFLEVKIDFSPDGKLLAIPAKGHGSGDLANLIEVDGYLLLPQGKGLYKAGEAYQYIPFRDSL